MPPHSPLHMAWVLAVMGRWEASPGILADQAVVRSSCSSSCPRGLQEEFCQEAKSFFLTPSLRGRGGTTTERGDGGDGQNGSGAKVGGNLQSLWSPVLLGFLMQEPGLPALGSFVS